MKKKEFWRKAILANLVVIFAIFLVLFVFSLTPPGRLVAKTLLLTSEVTPGFPIKPLKLITPAPKMEEVEIKVGDSLVKADLYRPDDNKSHPAAVVTLGVLESRKTGVVVDFSQSLSRTGLVVLVPDLPDFLSGFIWTDSVETMISSFEFLESQNFVRKDEIGFAGFCVGASVSMVAAEDPKIADRVSFITAVSPYFNAKDGVEAVILRKAKNLSGSWVPWTPAKLSIDTIEKGFIHSVDVEAERKLLEGYFFDDRKLSEDEVGKLSPSSRAVFDLLTNRDPDKFEEIWQRISPGFKNNVFDTLSPDRKIGNLKAALFILNDKVDTFVPKVEGEKFAKSLPKSQIYFAEVDSFEHVNPKTKLTRWAAIRQLFHLSNYLYRILDQVEK